MEGPVGPGPGHATVKEERWLGRFMAIWSGQAVSLIGSALVQFALIWWLTITTGSATVLALAAIMGIVPQILLTPFAGVYVDRWRRRLTMIGADGLMAITTAVLVALFALDVVQVWQVYIVLFARSCLAAFHWPASQAATALLVPERNLARVAGLNQSIYGLSSVLAPPMAAALFAFVPIQYILSIDILTALVAIVPLVLIRIPEPKPSLEERHVIKEMAAAWKVLRNWSGALKVIGIFLIANLLLSPAFVLMPLLVVDYFKGDALDLAWVEACFGVGAIAGGLLLGIWGGTKRRIVTVMAATALAGVGATLIGIVPSDGLLLLLALALFIGAMFSVLNGSIIAIIQSSVEPGMQGRILALISALAMSVTPIGLAFAGPLADVMGVQPWFIIAGVVTAVMGAVAFFIPSVMRIEGIAASTPGSPAKAERETGD
jgi:DHA3 family macrolide efflux protein-like MFS transporter